MICDEYSKEKEGTMTVISNGSIKKKIFMLLMIQSIYFVKSRKKKIKKTGRLSSSSRCTSLEGYCCSQSKELRELGSQDDKPQKTTLT